MPIAGRSCRRRCALVSNNVDEQAVFRPNGAYRGLRVLKWPQRVVLACVAGKRTPLNSHGSEVADGRTSEQAEHHGTTRP